MGDISGMCRLFDQPTYFSESANWNVVKFVHVAAATAPYSGDETGELDELAEATGHPDAIIGGIVPSDPIADTERLLDEQMAVAPIPRHPADGRHAPASRAPTSCAPSRSASWCSSSWRTRRARGLGRGARRLGRPHHRRRARRLAAVRHARGVRALGARHLRAGVPRGQRPLQAVGPGHAPALDASRRVVHRGSSTASSRSASTAACSRATSRSTRCTARSTSSTRGSTRVTADLDADARDKLFATNAERLYRC